MKFVIQLRPSWSPMSTCYFRVYQNGKEWVVRVHAKTATQFNSREEAQVQIEKFDLAQRHRASVIEA